MKMNSTFQLTANCQFANCLTEGVHPGNCQGPGPRAGLQVAQSKTKIILAGFADNYPRRATMEVTHTGLKIKRAAIVAVFNFFAALVLWPGS